MMGSIKFHPQNVHFEGWKTGFLVEKRGFPHQPRYSGVPGPQEIGQKNEISPFFGFLGGKKHDFSMI